MSVERAELIHQVTVVKLIASITLGAGGLLLRTAASPLIIFELRTLSWSAL